MNKIEFKDLLINLDEKICFIKEEEIRLTKLEFNLLVFLISTPNKVFSRKEIMNEVWGEDVKVTLRAVDTTVSRLRKKLQHLGHHINTRPGFGYSWKE